MGVEEKLMTSLLNNKVGAVNICCSECRMVSVVKDVSAGYTQLAARWIKVKTWRILD